MYSTHTHVHTQGAFKFPCLVVFYQSLIVPISLEVVSAVLLSYSAVPASTEDGTISYSCFSL